MSELKVGDRVTIRYSKKLEQSGYSLLANRSGVVTKVNMVSGKITGAYVNVYVMKKERNYHIPIASIEGPESVNKLRVLSILKTTTL